MRFEWKKPFWTVIGFTSKTDYVFMSMELLLILYDFYLVYSEAEICWIYWSAFEIFSLPFSSGLFSKLRYSIPFYIASCRRCLLALVVAYFGKSVSWILSALFFVKYLLYQKLAKLYGFWKTNFGVIVSAFANLKLFASWVNDNQFWGGFQIWKSFTCKHYSPCVDLYPLIPISL